MHSKEDFLAQEQQLQDRLLVIGSGVAGSATALIAAETHGIPVTLIYAGNVATDCNSYWAQGGIIYRNYNPKFNDSIASLAQDIHRAGAGLCKDAAVLKVATEGPDRVRQLLLDDSNSSGTSSSHHGAFAHVPFDKCRHSPDTLSLCLEASHSSPRILHKADHTGRVITQEITNAVARHPLIHQVPHTVVTDLMVVNAHGEPVNSNSHENDSSGDNGDGDRHVVGVQTLDRTTGMRSCEYGTYGTVLASGGLGGIYQHSTNPAGFNALGSSIALALRQGVVCSDLEFVQFHPTALHIPNEARFLLTEALRGEGAILRNAHGHAFARDYHEDGELAPRDVVARAVFEESRKTGKSVYLDITHRDASWLHERFPTIQQHLTRHGLDLAQDLLPITPAAHYTCGGIATDLHGCTSLAGLYAAGEAACTGLHGGNRLASTSLLEGLVFGASVADYVASTPGRQVRHDAMERLYGNTSSTRVNVKKQQAVVTTAVSSSSGAVSNANSNYTASQRRRASLMTPFHIEHAAHRSMQLLKALRKTMWDHVGVVRTPNGLLRALEELRPMQQEMDALHATWPTLETAAVRDAAHAGLAVAQAAWANRTSVGAHCIVPDAVVEPSTIDLGVIAADDEDDESARAASSNNKNGSIDSDSDEDEQPVAAAR
jgi:L-aspartate oxidase